MTQLAEVQELGCGVHPDFPKYIVFDDGAVISFIKKRPRLLRPIRTGNYVGLSLVNNAGNQRRVYIHRLVAEVFHGPCPDGTEACHIDGSRHNNTAANLYWGTRSQNMRDKERHGTAPVGEKHPHAKLTESAVREMRRLRERGYTLTHLMKWFGVSRMTCSRVCSHQLWRHVQ